MILHSRLISGGCKVCKLLLTTLDLVHGSSTLGGVEASGFGERPVMLDIKLTEVYAAEVDGTKDMEKMAFVPRKTKQKESC